MTYIRGNVAEFDAWEQHGNPGWNWNSLLPYFKKSEEYTVPTASQLAAGATYEPKYHGFKGPLHVGYIPALENGSYAPVVINTWASLSVAHNPDLNSGSVRGFGMGPQTLDTKLNIRWDAARAYYHPAEHRPNLHILKGTVKSITWASEKGKKGDLVAKGVEVLIDDGKSTFLSAKKEVIVSAGALRTPLVLEASGIGNPRYVFEPGWTIAEFHSIVSTSSNSVNRILKSLGVKTQINLPGVGENLVEQPSHFLLFSGDLPAAWSAYHAYVTAADIFGANTAVIEAQTRARIPKYAKAVADASGPGSLNVCAVEKLLQTQHDLVFKHNATAAEILIAIAGGGILASNYWTLFPFSRGSVHLKSLDKVNEPLINPRIFLADFDLTTLTAAGRFVEKFWYSEPMKSRAGVMGPTGLPNNATDEEWHTLLRNSGMNLILYLG